MKLRIADMVDDSVVDGEGYRLTVFVQGCPRRCPGCHNPATQPFDSGREIDTSDIISRMLANGLLTGVTFSGGEPFCQPRPLAEIAKAAHGNGLDVWAYTGNTLEELQAKNDGDINDLLANVDVLVDGDYREAERDLTLKFRGSRNQRAIDMERTRQENEIVLKYND